MSIFDNISPLASAFGGSGETATSGLQNQSNFGDVDIRRGSDSVAVFGLVAAGLFVYMAAK